MTSDVPPPYGSSDSPDPPPGTDGSPLALLGAYLDGTRAGAVDPWRIEGRVLVGRGLPLAIRLSEAVLILHEVPEDLADLTEPLERALTEAGLHRVEERTVLGHVVGIEVAGVRGVEWDLWAAEAERGHEDLKAEALGDVAERIDSDEPARRAREEETLQQIERDLWS